MMKRTFIALVLLGCLVPMPAHAEPVEIGRHLLASDLGHMHPDIQPGLPGRFFWGFPGLDLFGVVLTAADVGRTYRVNEQTDPNFAQVAARLTDGVDEIVEFGVRFPDSGWAAEQDVEGWAPTFTFHPALGDIVSAIAFRLDRFNLEEGPGFRRIQYAGVISIEGLRAGGEPGPAPIPEPATAALVGIGLGAVIRARRRRSDYDL